jgi:REP-associated tyrosine transposase
MANMVEHPGDYRWSSYRCHAYGELNKLVTDHPLYFGLGEGCKSRQQSYRELFNTVLTKQELHEIRTASSFSMPLGNSQFKSQVELMLKRSIGFSSRGRPEKKKL